MKRAPFKKRAQALFTVFGSPLYIVIAIVGTIIYYEVFRYLILSSNSGIFLVSVPIYLVYILVITSGVLLATSVFNIRTMPKTVTAGEETGAIGSALTSVVGGAIASCGCQFSVIASLLYLFGLGVVQTTGIVLLINSYQLPLIIIFILINLLLLYYNLGKSVEACELPKKKMGK